MISGLRPTAFTPGAGAGRMRVRPGRSGTVLAVLSVLFLPFFGESFPAEARQLNYDLICTTSSNVEKDAAQAVCSQFLQVLSQAYPGHSFANVQSRGETPSLQLQISAANQSVTAIRLVWTGANGQTVAGNIESVSVMDRHLTSSMQMSLFQRALASTPLPD